MTKGDSERAQDQDDSGAIVALAAVSGATKSVQGSNVWLAVRDAKVRTNDMIGRPWRDDIPGSQSIIKVNFRRVIVS